MLQLLQSSIALSNSESSEVYSVLKEQCAWYCDIMLLSTSHALPSFCRNFLQHCRHAHAEEGTRQDDMKRGRCTTAGVTRLG